MTTTLALGQRVRLTDGRPYPYTGYVVAVRTDTAEDSNPGVTYVSVLVDPMAQYDGATPTVTFPDYLWAPMHGATSLDHHRDMVATFGRKAPRSVAVLEAVRAHGATA